MKMILTLSLLTSALLAGLHETNEGLFLEVYEKHDAQSPIIAEVSTQKGHLEQLRCRGVRNAEWCKIRYRGEGVVLEGWSDKKSLDILAEAPNTKPTFEMRYGGRYGETGHDLLALDDGFLVVGSTESFGAGARDAYVVKTDRFGNKLWDKSYGGSRDDSVAAVLPFQEGYMLTGATYSFGNGNENLYALRIDADGQMMWQEGFYTQKRDRYMGKALALVNDIHVIVAGSQEHVKFFNGDTFCYLSAIDAKGRQKWEQSYGGSSPDRANSIVKVKDGYVFAGMTESWGDSGKNMYVVKIDEKGKRVWHQAFGGELDEVAHKVITTSDGGYLLVGYTSSDHRKLKDVYVVKLDTKGIAQWQRHYGGSADEEGLDVVAENDGYVIVGYTKSTKNLSSDLYLLKIDLDGLVVWKRSYGGEGNDGGEAIVKVDDGYVMTGFSDSTSDKGREMYLLKVDKEGRL